MRNSYLKGLNKALKQADFKRAQNMLQKPQAKLLLSKYLKDFYQARIYFLEKNESALINHLRTMMTKSYEQADEEQYLALYYHSFINQRNIEMADEILERIHQCENTKLIRYCDWTRAVLVDERNDLCDEITAALDNKDYYGFPLGTCTYLMGIQKKRMEAYDEALQWFDAAKDVLQKHDLYRTDALQAIDELNQMGYQLQPKRRKK